MLSLDREGKTKKLQQIKETFFKVYTSWAVSNMCGIVCRRGGFTPAGSQGQVLQGSGIPGVFAGPERTNRLSEPRFSRRY